MSLLVSHPLATAEIAYQGGRYLQDWIMNDTSLSLPAIIQCEGMSPTEDAMRSSLTPSYRSSCAGRSGCNGIHFAYRVWGFMEPRGTLIFDSPLILS